MLIAYYLLLIAYYLLDLLSITYYLLHFTLALISTIAIDITTTGLTLLTVLLSPPWESGSPPGPLQTSLEVFGPFKCLGGVLGVLGGGLGSWEGDRFSVPS